MKKVYAWVLATFVVAMGFVSLGCADDRPVYMDTADSGDSGGTAGTGGTSTGNTGTGGSGNNGTGGTGANTNDTLPGENLEDVWQVFSFDIEQSDSYDTFGYYEYKGDALMSCANSVSCMEDALNDTEGRAFQFLTTGSYGETFQGLLKGFCVYRIASCGPDVGFMAGDNCEDSDGHSRQCLIAGVLQLSEAATGSPNGELPASHVVNVGFESGDECQPVVFCFGAEHGVSFDDNGTYAMAYNPNEVITNKARTLSLATPSYKGLPK